MWNCVVFAVLLVPLVSGAGQFVVFHHPKSVVFKGHDHIKESALPEVYSAAVGYTTEQDVNWQGMYLSDPFHLAEAVMNVAVDGVSDLGPIQQVHSFPLRTDSDESATFDAFDRRIAEHSPSGRNHRIRLDLSEGADAVEKHSILKGIRSAIPGSYGVEGPLKASVEEDRLFLEEVALLNAIADRITSGSVPLKRDYSTDVFWFRVSGLHAVSDLHGSNSSETLEAKKILAQAVNKLGSAFNRVYDGSALITMTLSDASHTRKTRSLLQQTGKDEPTEPTNLAKDYDANYPVIFNIMLWFGVSMVFALLAISYFIGGMDPGRDSIIYRMTSTRMKKDN